MRWPPKYISLQKEGIEHIPSLSPSIKLLKKYQKKQDWDAFIKDFVFEFKENDYAQNDLDEIHGRLKQGEDIVLLCHEKSDEPCHRKLLAHLLPEDDDYYKGEVNVDDTDRLDWW